MAKLSTVAVDVQANAFAALFNNGFLRIYDDQQPSDPDRKLPKENLLAELRFGSPAFGPASKGMITANEIKKETSALKRGVAAWFRALKSDGATALMDGTVGLVGADLILNSVEIMAGAEVSVNSFQHHIPKSKE